MPTFIYERTSRPLLGLNQRITSDGAPLLRWVMLLMWMF
jgi:hypothetical protein